MVKKKSSKSLVNMIFLLASWNHERVTINVLMFLSTNSILCHLAAFRLLLLIISHIFFFLFECQVIFYFMPDLMIFTFLCAGFLCVCVCIPPIYKPYFYSLLGITKAMFIQGYIFPIGEAKNLLGTLLMLFKLFHFSLWLLEIEIVSPCVSSRCFPL